MVWQDFVISAVNIVLSASLVPEVYLGFKERKGFITLRTSIPTTLGLYTLSLCYLTLKLPFSLITSIFTATLWLVLLLQRLAYKVD
ncbi:MAG TPA: hypothetical protein VL945_00840 [Candidatus Saccharimonadales bacterium]|nr:hypothetical protein [Candidatus Saccharimonadales bacterium]